MGWRMYLLYAVGNHSLMRQHLGSLDVGPVFAELEAAQYGYKQSGRVDCDPDNANDNRIGGNRQNVRHKRLYCDARQDRQLYGLEKITLTGREVFRSVLGRLLSISQMSL